MNKVRVKIANLSHVGWSKPFLFNTNFNNLENKDLVWVQTQHGKAVARVIKYVNASPNEPTQQVLSYAQPGDLDRYRDSLRNQKYIDIAKELGYDFNDLDNYKISKENITIKNGSNASIRANILDEETMRNLGFTDHNQKDWYFAKPIKGISDISFNVTINKTTRAIEIDILDEDFLQHYQYQHMLSTSPDFGPARITHLNVQHFMKHLVDNGIVTNYQPNQYI